MPGSNKTKNYHQSNYKLQGKWHCKKNIHCLVQFFVTPFHNIYVFIHLFIYAVNTSFSGMLSFCMRLSSFHLVYISVAYAVHNGAMCCWPYIFYFWNCYGSMDIRNTSLEKYMFKHCYKMIRNNLANLL